MVERVWYPVRRGVAFEGTARSPFILDWYQIVSAVPNSLRKKDMTRSIAKQYTEDRCRA
jgi:hypothetical protein